LVKTKEHAENSSCQEKRSTHASWAEKALPVNESTLGRKRESCCRSRSGTTVQLDTYDFSLSLKPPGVERVFSEKHQAINYAQNRASFRSGEIRILDSTGKLEHTIAFSEADRKL